MEIKAFGLLPNIRWWMTTMMTIHTYTHLCTTK